MTTNGGRRGLLAAGAALAAGLLAPRRPAAGPAITVTDLLGRQVVLPAPARRVVLGSGRYLAVLNLLHPDPAALVVGWSDDFRRGQAGEYDAYRRHSPALDTVPVLARGNDALDREGVLALQPDLVLLTRSAVGAGNATSPASTSTVLRTLEAAGVPVAVVDFFQQPLADTAPSLRILGRLLGREDQAERFLAFYQARLSRVQALLPGDTERPSVMMHAHAGGLDCCYSPGRGTFDDFIRLAGGHNIAADRLTAVTGQLSVEYVLTRNPDIYIATGGPYGGRGGVSLGAGVSPQAARDSLRQILGSQHLDGLAAVRNGHAHGLWHGFNDSPAHMVAIEVMARWFHPARTGAIDPDATLQALNAQFAAVKLDGTYWIDQPG